MTENVTAGSSVYTASATDASPITYSLTGTNATDFSINATSGVVTINQSPDYESQTSYSFTVVASDGFGNDASQVVSVSVSDATDPAFSSGTTASVTENVTAGSSVYTASATDASPITYSLTGTNATDFSINATSGVVTINQSPDYESLSSYSFTVVASDGFGNDASQVVSVSVSDVDELPAFRLRHHGVGDGKRDRWQQRLYGQRHRRSPITYSLTGTNATDFSINATSGVVTINQSPDYESQTSYSFTVVASDGFGNDASQVVSVSVSDVTS